MAKLRYGITLLEIIIVVTIMMILMSIILPVFWKSKSQAHKISCSSNLHQLSLAMDLYLQDYDQKLPKRFFVDLSPVLGYAKSKDILRCPSDHFVKGFNWQATKNMGFKVTYLPPPTLDEGIMADLMAKDENYGIYICPLHDGGKVMINSATPSPYEFLGKVQRARIDGSVTFVQPRVRCFRDPSNGAINRMPSLWDFFTDTEPSPETVKSMLGGMELVNCSLY